MLTPLLLILFLLLCSVLPVPIPYTGVVKPHLLLMAVYYWSVYRPTLVPPFLCFALGLALDIVSGAPAGINAFTLVAARWTVSSQRRFLMGQPYVTLWAVFALVNILAALAQYLLFALVFRQWPPFPPAAFSVLAGIFLFPPVTLLLVLNHRILPVASGAQP